MMKAVVLATALLLAVAGAEAASGRDLLARCDDQTQLRCGGRCVNFLVDPRNCGKCGHRCDKTHICVNGGCICPAHRPNECGVPGRCTQPLTDPMNCGNCGNICPSGVCIRGECVGDDGCSAYQMRCAGQCRNILVDNKNCGKCGVTCKGRSVCFGGGCICPKHLPDICVKNECTNKHYDRNHCGTCFNKCKKGEKCHHGKCKRK